MTEFNRCLVLKSRWLGYKGDREFYLEVLLNCSSSPECGASPHASTAVRARQRRNALIDAARVCVSCSLRRLGPVSSVLFP